MSPNIRDDLDTVQGFPRVSGDEPDSAITTILETLFSPRERG